MSRLTVSLLVLGITLGLVAAFTLWSRRPVYFCEAAETPAAYQNEWFYRLHAGPDGWLLRDDDLITTAAVEPSTLAYLTRLTDALEAQGVTLVLAAQPPRGVALPPESLPDYDPGAALARYAVVRSALEATGLHVTDLGSVAASTPNYFFKRDHHWTPDGAEASAQAVADTVRTTRAYEGLEPKTFQTETTGREEQVGSFGEAIGRICGRNPPAERLTRHRTTAQSAVQETPAGDLFGDASAPPITLVGTSNSAREDLNFAGFLEEATGFEVLNAAATGGGPQAALESYLRSETFHQATPGFIVWEFATLFDVPQDPLFYRQLIPSVKGVCKADAATVTRELEGTSLSLFDSPGSGRNLYLEFSDLSVKSFELEVRYRNGRSETLSLRRSGREVNDGSYSLELLGQPARITLTPQDATGDVQARLCS